MVLGYLHEDQGDPIRVDDVHLVQTPWFPAGLAGDHNATIAEFFLGPVEVSDLQPQGPGKFGAGQRCRFAVAGKFDQ